MMREKRMNRSFWSLFCPLALLFAFMFLVINCAPPPSQLPTTPAQYSFTPPSSSSKKNNVIIAVVSPTYNAEGIQKNTPVITTDNYNMMLGNADALAGSMATDMQAIILARGFNYKGPFRDLDSMTYPDKKNADLILIPSIYINTQYSTTGKGMPLVGSPPGKLTINGFVELIILEPLSGQKMWIKKIDFTSAPKDYRFSYYVTDHTRKVMEDTRPEALKSALEDVYPKIMATAWTYLNEQEIIHLNQESKEVRDKKRY